MSTQEKVLLTVEQAISLLGDRKEIHTFVQGGFGLLGADHSRESIEKTLNNAHAIEIGGPGCKSMGHGLCVWRTEKYSDLLFIEVDSEELEKFEK